MSATTIKVSCIDQTLTYTSTPVIASGGVEEDFVQFTFCDKWDGYAKTAVFWRTGSESYFVVLDASNTVAIPSEVMQDEGVVFFGVFGVDASGARRTSEVLTYRIYQGAVDYDTELPTPTPDVFDQLLQQYADTRVYVASTVAAAAASAADAATAASNAEASAASALAAVADLDGLVYPGVPAAVTTGGTMKVPLSCAPSGKMLLTFEADAAASSVTSFCVEYTSGGSTVQDAYTLYDSYGNALDSAAFKASDVVAVVLVSTEAGKRAYMLNPRITRDVRTLITGLSSSISSLQTQISNSGGVEVVTRDGTGTSQISLTFSKVPKLIMYFSDTGGLSGGQFVVFKGDSNAAIISTSSGTNAAANWNAVTGTVTWGTTVKITFSATGDVFTANRFNGSLTEYRAVAFF